MEQAGTGTLHHLELWVPDLGRAVATWGWLLGALGYQPYQEWPEGQSWRSGVTYIVLEQSPARTAFRHDRYRPGLNHLAFHVDSSDRVAELVAEAPRHGWRLLFGDRHPYAGGTHQYTAYLENVDGYEAELVAPLPVSSAGPDSAAAPAAATAVPGSAPAAVTAVPGSASAGGAAGGPEPTTTDSGRSRDERPTEITNFPAGQVQPPAASS